MNLLSKGLEGHMELLHPGGLAAPGIPGAPGVFQVPES